MCKCCENEHYVSIKSKYDFQSYNDYINGLRKYFTIGGAVFEQKTNQNNIEYLKYKYKVTDKLAEDYIKAYEMGSGIIDNSEVITNLNESKTIVGRIAYIKDECLFVAYIWNICEFDIKDNIEKIVKESFIFSGYWNYNTCNIFNDIMFQKNKIEQLIKEVSNDKLKIKTDYDLHQAILNNIMDIIEKQSDKLCKCLKQINDSDEKYNTQKEQQTNEFKIMKFEISNFVLNKDSENQQTKEMILKLSNEITELNSEANNICTNQISNYDDKINKLISSQQSLIKKYSIVMIIIISWLVLITIN